MRPRASLFGSMRGAAVPATEDLEDESSGRVLPRTPVYPQNIFRPTCPGVEPSSSSRRLLGILRDRKFHLVTEVVTLMGAAELLTGMRDLIVRGHAFDRSGGYLRLRWRLSSEAPQSVSVLLRGIELEASSESEGDVGKLSDDGLLDDPEEDVSDGGLAVEEDEVSVVGVAEPGLVLSDPPSALTLPARFVHSMASAILAKRGSGKSYLGMVLVEEILRLPEPPSVVVFDPTGSWWGLCSTDGGAPADHEILLLGGSRGHLPLVSGDGRRVAELARAIAPVPVIVDVSEMAPSEQHEVVADFCERLMALPRFQVHVVFDEADEFAPQRFTGSSSHQSRCLGSVMRLVMRGRSRGIGTTLISLRPAVLSKNVLSQVEALYLMRMVEPTDLVAVRDRLERFEQGVSDEQRMQCLGILPMLPVGTSYFLRSGDEVMFRRFKVRRKRTFDSSRTPDGGLLVQATLRAPGPSIMGRVKQIMGGAKP